YISGFIAFLWQVQSQFIFETYYPEISTLKPGQPVDQRYSLAWYLFLFSNLRLPYGLAFIWLLRRMGAPWKVIIFTALFLLLFVLEFLTLIVGWYYWITA